jgi:G:T-mismatch repair DNA endonuclease (very short patch repair protein)
MINEIILKSNGLKILNREKKGKYTNFIFEDNSLISSNKLYQKKIKIKCHCCSRYKEIKFYYALLKKEYICQTCNKIGDKNGFYGKNHSEDFKKSLSEERKGVYGIGDKNGFFGRHHTNSVKKILSEASSKLIGDKNGFYGKHHTNETKEKIIEANNKWREANPELWAKMKRDSAERCMNRKYHKTKPEKKVEDYLKENGIDYKYNFILDKKYQYDFYIGNKIIIEVQGDYWHGNPLKYGEGLKPLNDIQKFKIERDKIKKIYAEENGYKIVYIWESDINKNKIKIDFNI